MTGHFQTRFEIGDRVRWYSLYAKVIGIMFDATGVYYTVAFETGGAKATVPSQELADE